MIRPLLLRFALALSLCLGVLAAPYGASAFTFDTVAARINSDIITLYEVRQAAIPYLVQRGLEPSEALGSVADRAQIYREVLNDLIERELIVQEGKKIGIAVTDAELEQWIGYMRQQQNMSEEEFKAEVELYGMDYEDYREMMRENLLRQRIIQTRLGSKVSISDAELEDAYRARFGELSGLETYSNISHILFQPATVSESDLEIAYQRAVEARRRLKQGRTSPRSPRSSATGRAPTRKACSGRFAAASSMRSSSKPPLISNRGRSRRSSRPSLAII